MRMPWQRPRPVTVARQEAEARTREVEREVVVPLRRVRAVDHLTAAVLEEMRRQALRGEQ